MHRPPSRGIGFLCITWRASFGTSIAPTLCAKFGPAVKNISTAANATLHDRADNIFRHGLPLAQRATKPTFDKPYPAFCAPDKRPSVRPPCRPAPDNPCCSADRWSFHESDAAVRQRPADCGLELTVALLSNRLPPVRWSCRSPRVRTQQVGKHPACSSAGQR